MDDVMTAEEMRQDDLDTLAALAMVGLLAGRYPDGTIGPVGEKARQTARCAYDMAEAMLEERDRRRAKPVGSGG